MGYLDLIRLARSALKVDPYTRVERGKLEHVSGYSMMRLLSDLVGGSLSQGEFHHAVSELERSRLNKHEHGALVDSIQHAHAETMAGNPYLAKLHLDNARNLSIYTPALKKILDAATDHHDMHVRSMHDIQHEVHGGRITSGGSERSGVAIPSHRMPDKPKAEKRIGGGGYGHGPAMQPSEVETAQQWSDGYLAGRRGEQANFNSSPLAFLHGHNSGTAARKKASAKLNTSKGASAAEKGVSFRPPSYKGGGRYG